MQEFFGEFPSHLSEAATAIGYGSGMLLLTWPLFLLLERRIPAGAPTPRSNFVFNGKVIVCNLAVTPIFYALALAITVFTARSSGLPALPFPAIELPLGIPILDTLAQGAILFVTAVFLGDLWYYWWHRMQHELPALWEIHKLHHSDENLNSTSILRSHFFELAGQALVRGMTVGLLFDLRSEPQALLAILAVGLLPPLWDIFIHANVRVDALRHLLPFFSTPQYHWVHHSKLPQHQDKNYAIWLPVFDVIFGSYYRPDVDEYPPTGLSSGEPVGSVWEEQTRPFAAWLRMLRGDRAGALPE